MQSSKFNRSETNMNSKCVFSLLAVAWLAASRTLADDITTLDGQKYEDVRDVALKPNGLFFVTTSGGSMKGVTVPYSKLTDEVKDKYHYGLFAVRLRNSPWRGQGIHRRDSGTHFPPEN